LYFTCKFVPGVVDFTEAADATFQKVASVAGMNVVGKSCEV
jgi:hypothetical protein